VMHDFASATSATSVAPPQQADLISSWKPCHIKALPNVWILFMNKFLLTNH
jgi:hypothetical protein